MFGCWPISIIIVLLLLIVTLEPSKQCPLWLRMPVKDLHYKPLNQTLCIWSSQRVVRYVFSVLGKELIMWFNEISVGKIISSKRSYHIFGDSNFQPSPFPRVSAFVCKLSPCSVKMTNWRMGRIYLTFL